MKKITIALALLATACGTAPVSQPGPTAVMSGQTEDQVATAISSSLVRRGWRINEHENNRFLATLSESDWSVTIAIPYSATKYEIVYHDSKNFKYNEKKQTIDEHYGPWIDRLQDTIDKNLR